MCAVYNSILYSSFLKIPSLFLVSCGFVVWRTYIWQKEYRFHNFCDARSSFEVSTHACTCMPLITTLITTLIQMHTYSHSKLLLQCKIILLHHVGPLPISSISPFLSLFSITFYLAVGLTALSFVLERKEGLLDRCWVAGEIAHIHQMAIIWFRDEFTKEWMEYFSVYSGLIYKPPTNHSQPCT